LLKASFAANSAFRISHCDLAIIMNNAAVRRQEPHSINKRFEIVAKRFAKGVPKARKMPLVLENFSRPRRQSLGNPGMSFAENEGGRLKSGG
jgi:hypothetical protein